jgi:hypothetical protein
VWAEHPQQHLSGWWHRQRLRRRLRPCGGGGQKPPAATDDAGTGAVTVWDSPLHLFPPVLGSGVMGPQRSWSVARGAACNGNDGCRSSGSGGAGGTSAGGHHAPQPLLSRWVQS